MRRPSAAVISAGLAVAMGVAAIGGATPAPGDQPAETPSARVDASANVSADVADLRFQLSDRLADVKVEGGAVRVDTPAGERVVDAAAFLRAVEARQRARQSRHWLLQLADVTSPLGLIWVAVGFLGQLVFMGRMVVQWLASEKHKQSVVPPAFWWMSLIGGSMVLAYFLWRKDIVGIFGQAMGWTIYARNLWLIYRRPAAATPAVTATPTGPVAEP